MAARASRMVWGIGLLGQTILAGGASAQVLAFPEAEGFGRFATGARTDLSSASVYHVTNLNDSGPGSFRDAVSQPNRFVVFDVGGIININSVVTVAPNVTIAGQTAPGGVALYGNRIAFHGANNLVARHFSVRLGTAAGRVDAASIVRGQNMIFDHMSITWGVDGTFDINPDSGAVIDNITIQNTIIGQGLDVVGHSTGGLMTLGEGRNFSIIKSLFIDNVTRNPKVRGNNEFINNVVYGYETSGYIMGDTSATSNANVQGNYFIEGPVNGSSPFASGTSSFHIYASDNWVDGNRNGVLDGSLNNSYPGADVVSTRHNFPTVPSMTAQEAVQFVIENVGPHIIRDAVDTRLVQEVASYGTLGGVIERESHLFPGYGTDPKYLNPRARLTDSDNDGIPDNWETSRGLNPSNASDWRNLSGGYTQLEHYLNELGGYGATRISTGGAWTSPATWGGAVPTFADTAIVTGGLTHTSGNGFARRLALEGTSTMSGGTIDVFDTVQVGAAGNGSLAMTGGTLSAGRVVLGGAGQTGSLTVGPGAILQTGSVISGGGTGQLTIDGGMFRATGAPDIAVPLTIGSGGAIINTNGFSGSITGGLSGTGMLTKNGGGTLTLGGNNSAYSGTIRLNTGQIILATNAANSSTGTILMANGTQLNVTASGASTPIALMDGATATIAAGGLTYNGAITGAAGTVLQVSNGSTGTSNFSFGGNMSNFAGTFRLIGTGNIRIGSAGSALADFDLGNSTGTIRTTFDGVIHFGSLSGGSSTRLQGSTNGTTASTYIIGANGRTTTFAGTITDGTNSTPAVLNITKTGEGTLNLTGANTYTGVTTVQDGTLRLGRLAHGPVLSGPGGADIQGGRLVLDYAGGGANPAAQVLAALTASHADNWATGQIRSTTMTAGRALGWIDNGTQVVIAYAAPGDVDLDRQTSLADIQAIQAANTFNKDVASTWRTGDFNYDGRTTSADIQLILAGNTYNQGTYAATAATPASAISALSVVYDPANGNITLRSDGSTINGFILTSADGILTGSAANLPAGGFFSVDEDQEISTSFVSISSDLDLGNVAPAGLTQAAVAQDLTLTYTVEGVAGIFTGELTLAPEPGVVGLMAIGGVGLLGRRRRRVA